MPFSHIILCPLPVLLHFIPFVPILRCHFPSLSSSASAFLFTSLHFVSFNLRSFPILFYPFLSSHFIALSILPSPILASPSFSCPVLSCPIVPNMSFTILTFQLYLLLSSFSYPVLSCPIVPNMSFTILTFQLYLLLLSFTTIPRRTFHYILLNFGPSSFAANSDIKATINLLLCLDLWKLEAMRYRSEFSPSISTLVRSSPMTSIKKYIDSTHI